MKALALLLFMALLGCAHLLVRDHYFIINYDSFYFHHLVQHLDQDIPVVGRGLAYPLVALGELVGLDAASMMISPLLGILTGLVLYWGVSKLYSQRIALLAVVCFVFAQIPRFVFMSGNLDRDGLHMLIMTAGILGLGLFFKTQDKGYLSLVFVSIPVLVLEWGLFGLAQYIPVLAGMCVITFRSKRSYLGIALLAVGAWAIGRGVMELSYFANTDISELEPWNLQSVIQYATIAVPVVFGVKRADEFPKAWLTAFLIMGFFASRLSIYAVMPACIIGAFGLEAMWEKRSEWRYVFVAGCLIFVSLSWVVPKNVSMPNDWHDALVWVRTNTPEDATIGVWWSYGYWVLDVADRDPSMTDAVDTRNEEMARVYFSPHEEYAHDIAERNDWDYIIMSIREEHFMSAIKDRAGKIGDWEPFYAQVLSREVGAVYANNTVVVLKS